MSKRLAPVLLCLTITAASATAAERTDFGHTKDGEAVYIYTLSNDSGATLRLLTLGATLHSLEVPDRQGNLADVVFGFDDVASYEGDDNQYFGCTTGRYANRIAKGRFTLDGEAYQLATNDGPNHLHGGAERSLDKVIWERRAFRVEQWPRCAFHLHEPRW